MKACGARAARMASAAHLDAAVGAVLEADRAAQARGELAVALALRRARADGAPGDQVGDVLRAEQVEELGAQRQAQRGQVQQQPARHLQALVDGEAAVQVRVVDVALPADGGARLLEVGAHHDQQVAGQLVGHGLQAAAVVERLVVVVDRAGADDDDQPVVAAMQHVGDGTAAALHQFQCVVAQRHALLQQRRVDQRAHGADAHVVDAGGVQGLHARVSGQGNQGSEITTLPTARPLSTSSCACTICASGRRCAIRCCSTPRCRKPPSIATARSRSAASRL